MEGTLPLAMLAALSCLGSRLDSDGLIAATGELIADAQSSQDGGFQGWTVLAISALVIDPAVAADSLDEAQGQPAPLQRLIRPNALGVLDKLPPMCRFLKGRGSKDGASIPLVEATLSQLLQGWWQELPSWERRARSV
eukprot:Skav209509  [mRNA]  locus=scaffold2767:181790:185151:+ [translate_table: standard]